MWLDLRGEVEHMFGELVVYVPEASGTRFFRRELSEDVVARVARWRAKNRDRRNATARANYARNAEKIASYQREWRAQRKDKPS